MIMKSTWESRPFDMKIEITRNHVQYALSKALKKVKFTEEEEKDVVRLWIMFILTSFLYCKNKYRINKKFFNFVDDWDELEELNWGSVFHDLLFNNIDKCMITIKRRIQIGVQKFTVQQHGCVMVLMVWLFKNTSIAKINEGKEKDWPYYKKWSGTISYNNKKISNLASSKVVEKSIEVADDRQFIEFMAFRKFEETRLRMEKAKEKRHEALEQEEEGFLRERKKRKMKCAEDVPT